MPRKPKPKNALSAGERARLYEAELEEKQKRMLSSAEESQTESPVLQKTEENGENAGREEKPAKAERPKKSLPKPQKAIVKADLSIPVGEIRPLHGVCNGPVSYGADISRIFKEMGVPTVRFDGADTPMSGCAVDVSKIFRNPDADPTDEANYDFSITDKYVTAARMTGAEIVYRLGESRDLFDLGRRARRIEDLDTLARVCVNIIRHYNDRWAKGFSLDIKYFELWSRDGSGGESLQEDIEIYRRLAGAVKLYDEDLKVGGMCFGGKVGEVGEFLRYCKKNRVPLDFLTVDCFGGTPEKTLSYLSGVIKSAKNYGDGELEIMVGKWAFAEIGENEDFFEILASDDGRKTDLCKKIIADRYSLKNAAYSAAFLLGLDDLSGISGAFLYDAQPVISPFCSIADRLGEPTKTYYALRAFGELYRAKNKVFCECEVTEGIASPGIYTAAAVSEDGEAYIVIASFDGCGTVDLRIDGISENLYTAEVYMLDGVKNMEPVASAAISGPQKRLVLNLCPYGVAAVKLY